jgi:hypothetical protein
MTDNETALAVAKRAAYASLEQLTGAVGPAQRARLAHNHKAFQRARAIPNPDVLLLLLLFYTHADVSLRLTTWFALVGFGITISAESLADRFRHCGPWLKALVCAQLAATARLTVPSRTRLRIVDGTVLCRPGATGTEWRVHLVYEPGASAPRSVEVTDAHGAEGLNQGVQEEHTLVLGDRNYGRYREVQTARARHVELLARTHLQTQPMQDANGIARTPRWWTAAAEQGRLDHPVQLTRGGDPVLTARLLVVPLPPEVAGRTRQKVRKAAAKKGKSPDALALHLAGYLCLLTTLGPDGLSVQEACSLYRIRWQVELFFKRAKSLAHLDAIRGGDTLVQAQVWARLLSLCDDEARRPSEATCRPKTTARTGRPAALWRWLQVARLIWIAPFALLALLKSPSVALRDQEDRLRERPRRRGVRDVGDSFPQFAAVGGG